MTKQKSSRAAGSASEAPTPTFGFDWALVTLLLHYRAISKNRELGGSPAFHERLLWFIRDSPFESRLCRPLLQLYEAMPLSGGAALLKNLRQSLVEQDPPLLVETKVLLGPKSFRCLFRLTEAGLVRASALVTALPDDCCTTFQRILLQEWDCGKKYPSKR